MLFPEPHLCLSLSSLPSVAQPLNTQWPPRVAKCGISRSLTVRALVDEMLDYPVVDGVTVLVLPPAGVVRLAELAGGVLGP